MKKKTLLLLPLLALLLTSCNFLKFFYESSEKPFSYDENDTSQPSGIKKTTLSQTYKDYEDNSVYDTDSCPTIGEIKLLVIPIWFTDSTSYISIDSKEMVREDIKKAYTGTQEETGWHSVKTYYETESFGKLTLDATVSDWYNTNTSSRTYRSDDDCSKTCALVKSASDWYFTSNPSDSRTNYDADNNGFLDGVMLIYGAANYMSINNSSASNLWAYCFWIQDNSLANKTNPGPNSFFWASYDFMYSSNSRLVRERTAHLWGYGDTTNCNIDAHTYIHEMGHIFGLDDYYDYGSNRYNPAGGLTMQDYNVGGHDPFSVMALGWASPYIVKESADIVLRPFQSSHDLILLTPSFNDYGSAFDEYLLVEFYTPTGLNSFDSKYYYKKSTSNKLPTNSGIRVWHVDARLLQVTKVVGDRAYFSDELTSNVNGGMATLLAMSNSYEGEHVNVESFKNYNVLQYIRNNLLESYKPTSNISNSNMFYDGDTFTMSQYSNQFVNGSRLNTNKSLGYSFSVSIKKDVATIRVTKE